MIEGDRLRARQLPAGKREQCAHQPVRQQQPRRASGRGQYERFGEQLTHDTQAACAKC